MLQKAIESRDYTLAKDLLSKGEKLPNDIQNYRLSQVYRFLIDDKQFEIINALIDDGTVELDIYEYDTFDNTLFSSIINIRSVDEESLTFLTDFLSKVQSLNDELQGKSLLSLALDKEANPELIKVMIAAGCNAQIIDTSENNLIHKVVQKYVRSYEKGLVYLQLLFDEGVDIQKPNIVGATPLHLACREGREAYIKWLLEQGADPNVTDKKGLSPFFIVVAEVNKFEYYKIMREYAMPIFDQVTTDGKTMLYEFIGHMSADYDLDFLKLLLEDGADIHTISDYYGPKNSIDVAVTKPAHIIEVLLASGQLDVHWKDNQGNTPLHKVCAIETLREEKRGKEVYRIAKLLVAAGADIHMMNDKEETPIMLASKDNTKVKTVELLLSSK